MSNKIKMGKILCLFILRMFLISGVSALDNLGTFPPDQLARITQVCSDATWVNISSISLPNSTVAEFNISMNASGNGEFFYVFNNTHTKGRYDVRGVSDGCETEFAVFFNIGKDFTVQEAILYAIFLIIMFGMLILMFCFIIILPGTNEKGVNNEIMGIVKLKYLKIMLIALAYPTIIIILNLMTGLATHFTTLSIFANTIGFIFEIMLRVAWVFTFIIIIWILYLLVQDSNFKKHMKKMGNINLGV